MLLEGKDAFRRPILQIDSFKNDDRAGETNLNGDVEASQSPSSPAWDEAEVYKL